MNMWASECKVRVLPKPEGIPDSVSPMKPTPLSIHAPLL